VASERDNVDQRRFDLHTAPETHVMAIRLFLLVVFTLVQTTSNVVAQSNSWTQFRGPNGHGHAATAQLPVRFGESKNVTWKVAVPGEGHSSPVSTRGLIWLTTAVESKLSPEDEKARLSKIKNPRSLKLAGKLSLRAVCFDSRSGAQIHNVELFNVDEPEPKHQLNSYASPTPVIDGGSVYCHFGTYGTASLDVTTGEVIWKSDKLHCDHQNGPGSSPIIWNGLLIAHFDGIDEQFIAALDTNDGAIVWKQVRTSPMNATPEFRKAYCTPTIVEHKGQPLLISPAADWVYAYDPRNGEQLWRAHYGQLGFSTVPRPISGHGMVYICTSYMKSRLLAIRYDGTGDVTKSHIMWQSDSNIPKKPSLLLVGDNLFMVADNGVATCVDAKSGKQHWRERLDGNYSASPLFANGHIYFLSQEGKVTVVDASNEFKRLATNELKSGFMASPAIVDNTMFLRTESHLYRIEAAADKAISQEPKTPTIR
jgi:outer membrane protein assembly factor BamB